MFKMTFFLVVFLFIKFYVGLDYTLIANLGN